MLVDLLKTARGNMGRDGFSVLTTGVSIDEVWENGAVCSLETGQRHLNSAGFVMGGAVYTLADFCFAVAANTGKPLTVTASGSSSFHVAVRGGRLVARAECLHEGRQSCTYLVRVTNEAGLLTASFTFTGMRPGE